ncbi:uncharacterized protein LOC124899623 [Capsicum annuum]|uniref:uncharacterized protein LOC124899623 n=1 Tax=Capsicum annuum TaxID=4072 RepID=UPI001FB128D4|nr:uncharacterized protein LOC124899623 [Capsicum annuum]
MSHVTLNGLSNALQAVEQRKAFRKGESSNEVALVAAQKSKAQSDGELKRQLNRRHGKEKKKQYNNKGRYKRLKSAKQISPTAQVQLTQIAENVEDHEENLFATSIIGECNIASQDHDVWLVDSGCTHHMTANLNNFERLDKNYFFKVRVGNGRLLDAKGKGAVVVQILSGIKLIFDVLFVPEISQSFLSVGQLLENKYALLFKDKACEIMDPTGIKLLTVKMLNRSLPLDRKHTEIGAYVGIKDDSYVWLSGIKGLATSILSL